jgi:hypothetical protein
VCHERERLLRLFQENKTAFKISGDMLELFILRRGESS